METTQDRELIEAEHQRGLQVVRNAMNVEAGPNVLTVSFRPLVHFIKFNVQYLPMDSVSLDHDCPICRESASESHERMLQVNLPACKHIFGADCFERYIQRSHTCPMCRSLWFEKRLTPEMPSNPLGQIGQIVIEVSVESDQSADAFLDALRNDTDYMTRRLLERRVGQITELDDEEEDTDFQNSAAGEESDARSESSAISPVSNQLELTRIEVTFVALTEPGIDTEPEEETIVVLGRARGAGRRPASDDEAIAPPRQRRRYE